MKSILLSLAMPPTGFVTLIIIGLLLRGRWHRFGRRLALAATIGLLLLSLPIVSHTALVALETGLPTTPAAEHPPQAIIVLGAEVIRDRHEPLGTRPGLLTLDRLRAAAALQRRTGLPILVTGGTTQSEHRGRRPRHGPQPARRFQDAGALGRGPIRATPGKTRCSAPTSCAPRALRRSMW